MTVGVSEYFVPEVRRSSGTVVPKYDDFVYNSVPEVPRLSANVVLVVRVFVYSSQYEALCTFSM